MNSLLILFRPTICNFNRRQISSHTFFKEFAKIGKTSKQPLVICYSKTIAKLKKKLHSF